MGNVNRGYIIPIDPLPEDDYCLQVYIPRNTEYLIQFFTALSYFGKWNSWKRGEGTINKEVADRWKEAIERTHTKWAEGENCMPSFRINDETCLLEVDCAGDGTDWQPVFTPAYEAGSDAPHQTLYPDGVAEGQSVPCISAANTVAMLTNGATNFSNLLSLDELLGTIVAFLYTFLASVVTVTLSQLWLGLGVQYGAFDATQFSADLSAFDWDDLLCLLVDHYALDGTMTGEDWALVLDEMQTNAAAPNQIWLFLAMVWGLMGRSGAELATRWGGITEADCDVCDDTHIFELDFSVDSYGWDKVNNKATYVPGVGFQRDAAYEGHGIWIGYDFTADPDDAAAGQVEVEATTIPTYGWQLYCPGLTPTEFYGSDLSHTTAVFTSDVNTAVSGFVVIHQDNGTPNLATITRFRVAITGTIPQAWIDDNWTEV